jgi:hypothetical protein
MTHDNDDESILKDGERLRVSMMMRDSMSPLQRAIAQDNHETGRDKILRDAIEIKTAPMVTDAFGDSGAGLHRPGYRFGHMQRTVVDQAYQQHDQEESRRWQGSAREIPVKVITGDARMDAYLAREEHDTNAWRGPINSGKWY